MARPRLLNFWRDNRGAAIIYLSLAMPVLVGGMGLGAETGYRYFNQRLLQHAADVSAHAGAVRLRRGGDNAAVEAAALVVATGSGFDTGVGIVPISNVPPTSGAFTGDDSAVEVILRETRPRLFSAVFGAEPVTIAARAVAAVTGDGDNGCILALSETASGAVTVTGSTTTTLDGCSIISNSTAGDSIDFPNAAATASAECFATAGEIDDPHGNLAPGACTSERQGVTQDPYYWVQSPATSCTGGEPRNTGQNGQTTNVTTSAVLPNGVGVKYFCNGLSARGTVNFAPGLYVISGGTMTTNGTATIAGTGVTFYFTNTASMSFGSNATLNLSAPTIGPYKGLLFFGSRDPAVNPHQNNTIQGTPSSTFQGAIYMPASHVQFTGNSATTSGCTQVIANTVTLTGNSELSAECENAGTADIGAPTIAIVE